MSEHDTPSEQPRTTGLFGRLGHLAGDVGNAAIGNLDPNLVATQLDVDAIVARIDVNALLDRVEVDELLDRVDVDRLLEQVDVNRLLDRVDVDRLLERADVEELVRRGSGALGGNGILDVVRRQVVAIDTIVTRTLRRLLGQSTGEDLRGEPEELTGDPAGIVSRVLAVGVDVAAALMVFTILALLASTALTAVLGRDQPIGPPQGPWFIGLAAMWTFGWWVVTLAALGRTPGMLLVGLSVRSERGDDAQTLTPQQVVVRTLVQAVVTPLFGIGYITILFDARRRAVYDIVAKTVLVHDWGRRDAQISSPVGRFLADR